MSANYYYLVTPPINFNNVLAAFMFDVDTDKSASDSNTSYSWVNAYNGIKFITTKNLWGVGWIAIGN